MYAKRPAAQARPTRSNKSMTSSLNVTRTSVFPTRRISTAIYPRCVPKCIANDFTVLEKRAHRSSLHNAIHRCKTHENRPALFLQKGERRKQKPRFQSPETSHTGRLSLLKRRHPPDGFQNARTPIRTTRTNHIHFPFMKIYKCKCPAPASRATPFTCIRLSLGMRMPAQAPPPRLPLCKA